MTDEPIERDDLAEINRIRATEIDRLNAAAERARAVYMAGEDEVSKEAGEGNEGAPQRPVSATYSVEAINEDYAVVQMGSGVFILKELSAEPVDNSQRMLTVPAFLVW